MKTEIDREGSVSCNSFSYSWSISSDEKTSEKVRSGGKRRQNPGRRYHQGHIYDSELGITCHFCKKKAIEDHVLCDKCAAAFCRRCLRTRHGEDIDIEMKYVHWICPGCRGGCGPGCSNCCTCSKCRKADGLDPVKFPSAAELRECGFNNVHDYLIHLKTKEPPTFITARKFGKQWCRSHLENPVDAGSLRPLKCSCKKAIVSNDSMSPSVTKEAPRNRESYGSCYTTKATDLTGSVKACQNPIPSSSMAKACQNPIPSSSMAKACQNPIPSSSMAKACQNPIPSSSMAKACQNPIPSSSMAKACQNPIPSSSMAAHTTYKYSEVSKTHAMQSQALEHDNRSPVGKCGMAVTHSEVSKKHVGKEPVPERSSFNIHETVPCNYSSPTAQEKTDSKDRFKRDLEVLLATPFDPAEFKDKWQHVRCRKPIRRTMETRAGTYDVASTIIGRSYIDHYPDLAFKLTAATTQEEKLKLLRGFFYWLEHASSLGAFQPWTEKQKEDDDCMVLDASDCEVYKEVYCVEDNSEISELIAVGSKEDVNTDLKQRNSPMFLPLKRMKQECAE